ncbi:MAG: M23 family metallopeptidase [Bacteroidota bacterium]
MKLRTFTSLLTVLALAYLCKLGFEHRQAEEAARTNTNVFSTGQPTAATSRGDRPAEVQTQPTTNREDEGVTELEREVPTAVQTSGDELVFPVAKHDLSDVISVFGDPRGRSRLHQGIDVKAPRGTSVLAVADGFIERLRYGGNAGKSIYLRAADGKLYFYAHLDTYEVEEMQAVSAGERIGTVGDTGNAANTTPHLHFEILIGKDKEAVDPLPFFLSA